MATIRRVEGDAECFTGAHPSAQFIAFDPMIPLACSVHARLSVLVGALLLGAVGLSALAVWLPREVQGLLKTVYADRVVPLSQLKAVSDAYAVTVVDVLHKYRDGALSNERAAEAMSLALAWADTQWAAFKATHLTDREAELVHEAQTDLQRASAAAKGLVAALKADNRPFLDEFGRTRLYPTIEPLTRSLHALSELQQTVAQQAYEDGIGVIGRGQHLVTGLCGLVIGLGAWAGLRMARSVTQPLREAVRLTEAVAAGARQTPISARGPDEVVQMLMAVERMRVVLVERADRDELTGLLVRRRFDELLASEWQRSARQRSAFAVLLLDLDRFKQVNDLHGHAMGDRVLRASAGALMDSVRGFDHVARYGGEEFAVLLPGASALEAAQVAERVRQAVAQATAGQVSAQLRTTVSIGVAAWRTDESLSVQALMAAADEALYRAKRGGRDQVRVAASLLDPPTAPAQGGHSEALDQVADQPG